MSIFSLKYICLPFVSFVGSLIRYHASPMKIDHFEQKSKSHQSATQYSLTHYPNPCGVGSALLSLKKIRNYWFKSGTLFFFIQNTTSSPATINL